MARKGTEKAMVLPPSGALTMPCAQVVAEFDGVAIFTPAGRLSVKARSDTWLELWLKMSN